MREEHSSVVLPRVTLPSGAYFEELTQAYGDYGEGDETILVCHALTGSWKLAGERRAGEPEPWWGAVVGDGMALDTRRYRVICFNNLGSPYGSTSPAAVNPADGRRWAMRFPILSPRDTAFAQKAALEALGVKRLRAVVGGSLGGMIALEAAISFPDFANSCALIAAPDRLYPQAIAFNAVQRQSIMDDPQWRGGDYEGAGPVNGLAAARMLAMITYKSEQTFSNRYMREMADEAAGAWGGQFQIESYLHHHGQELVKRFDANCYLYLTRMMDLHDIGAGRPARHRRGPRRRRRGVETLRGAPAARPRHIQRHALPQLAGRRSRPRRRQKRRRRLLRRNRKRQRPRRLPDGLRPARRLFAGVFAGRIKLTNIRLFYGREKQ